jgi:hygromycin-B 4-O-kinase
MTNEQDTGLIHTIVGQHLGADITSITSLKGGFFSRAFIVAAGGRDYVVRINAAAHARESFQKDDYAWRHFADHLPIPRVVAIGETGSEWYAISERLPGVTLSGLPAEERDGLLPEIIDMLEVIGSTDISGSQGYGDWDGSGDGRYGTWPDYLAQIIEDEPEGSYYANWHAMFDETFLERDVYEAVYQRMMKLTAFCPDTRALIHNDIQFENILSDGERITGVIDWANSLFGDPLYDVARWFWWTGTYGWFGHGDDLLHDRFRDEPNFAERIACYQCHIGLDDLKFCAKNGMHEWYNIHRDRLLRLVAE